MLSGIAPLNSSLNSSYEFSKQWDDLNSTANQFANLILEAENENQLRAFDLIIEKILTKHPVGDSNSSLNTLAKLILLKQKQSNDHDVTLACKTLRDGGIMNRPFPKSTLEVEFNEKSFKEMEAKVRALLDAVNIHKKIIEIEIAKIQQRDLCISTPTIQKASELIKEIEFVEKEIQIPFWMEHVHEIVNKLIGVNAQWTKYITELYEKITHQQKLLSDKKLHNYETYTTRFAPKWLNYSDTIKTPDLKTSSEIPLDVNQKYNTTNFITFFLQYKHFISDIENFVSQSYTHLSDTSGTRHALLDSCPVLEGLKQIAQGLYDDYQGMHDKCIHIFNRLNNMTFELEQIQNVWENELSQLSQAKTEIGELTQTLKDEHDNLYQFECI